MLVARGIVLAELTDKMIVARTAFQYAAAASGQGVGETRSENLLEIGQRVETGTMRILLRRFAQVHRNEIRRMLVTHRVGTAAAIERVVPQSTFDHVVIAVTRKRIVEI